MVRAPLVKTINLGVPEDLWLALSARRQTRGVPIAEFIRRSIRFCLTQEKLADDAKKTQ